ncbi:MAG: hypothetical protein AAF547_11670 [Actinomycetota bacterium]
MTIEKGQVWGQPAPDLTPEATLDGDAAVAELVDAAVRAGRRPVVSMTGGDLLATLGLDGPRPPADRHAYPVDLVRVRLDPDGPPDGSGEIERPDADGLRPFVAHLTGRVPDRVGPLIGHGPPIVVAAMNAAWLGPYRLGPRAHPNDGVVDIIEGRVPFTQRREAANRARSGSHLPHPALAVARRRHWFGRFDRAVTIHLDGVEVRRVRSLALTVVPDAWIALV